MADTAEANPNARVDAESFMFGASDEGLAGCFYVRLLFLFFSLGGELRTEGCMVEREEMRWVFGNSTVLASIL